MFIAACQEKEIWWVVEGGWIHFKKPKIEGTVEFLAITHRKLFERLEAGHPQCYRYWVYCPIVAD